MKNKIKKILPKAFKKRIVNYRFNSQLKSIVKSDRRRFYNYTAHGKYISNSGNINSQLMYFTHQIEKGLSRKDFRMGFGRQVIINLVDTLLIGRDNSEIRNGMFYANALSALKAYEEKHKYLLDETNVPNFDVIPEKILEEIKNSGDYAGVLKISSLSKKNNNTIDFKTLALNRYSIRDFKEEKVSLEKIESAIEISMKTPTVCNRQPARVKIIEDKEKIQKLLILQGGFNGYKNPDKLILVTSELSSYLRTPERNQGFVDGGLFSMSLMYALEYEEIASCPLSTNVSEEKAEKIREILNIPASEVLIMFIACGIMEDVVLAPKSHRLQGKDITTKY